MLQDTRLIYTRKEWAIYYSHTRVGIKSLFKARINKTDKALHLFCLFAIINNIFLSEFSKGKIEKVQSERCWSFRDSSAATKPHVALTEEMSSIPSIHMVTVTLFVSSVPGTSGMQKNIKQTQTHTHTNSKINEKIFFKKMMLPIIALRERSFFH